MEDINFVCIRVTTAGANLSVVLNSSSACLMGEINADEKRRFTCALRPWIPLNKYFSPLTFSALLSAILTVLLSVFLSVLLSEFLFVLHSVFLSVLHSVFLSVLHSVLFSFFIFVLLRALL